MRAPSRTRIAFSAKDVGPPQGSKQFRRSCCIDVLNRVPFGAKLISRVRRTVTDRPNAGHRRFIDYCCARSTSRERAIEVTPLSPPVSRTAWSSGKAAHRLTGRASISASPPQLHEGPVLRSIATTVQAPAQTASIPCAIANCSTISVTWIFIAYGRPSCKPFRPDSLSAVGWSHRLPRRLLRRHDRSAI